MSQIIGSLGSKITRGRKSLEFRFCFKLLTFSQQSFYTSVVTEDKCNCGCPVIFSWSCSSLRCIISQRSWCQSTSTFYCIFFSTSPFSLHPLKSVWTPKNTYDLADLCWGSSHISSLLKAFCPKAEHHYKLSNQLVKCYFIFVSMHWFPPWCDSPTSHSLTVSHCFPFMLTLSHSVFSADTFLSTKCTLAVGFACWNCSGKLSFFCLKIT